MTIELTPAQYETLLKLVYLGEWMANGIRTEEERDEKIHQAAQHFYSYADEADAGALIEYDKEYHQYVSTPALDDDAEIVRFREEYDDEVFWDELIEKLAMRDFANRYGEEHWFSGGVQDGSDIQSGFINKYVDEFEANGIGNLIIKGDEL
ncbi:hypothetical protein HY623_00090 [Candidatus Uhrbacteria bacterium]|nr:hypothetical protein [Candidatus Uhrbacteria bacterium]